MGPVWMPGVPHSQGLVISHSGCTLVDDSHLAAERRAPKEGELSLGIGLVTCVKAHTHVSLNPRHQYERLKL